MVVRLCDVLDHPRDFDGKELVLTAGLRLGFEWQELMCFTCNSAQRVWVEFDEDVKGWRRIGKARAFDQVYKVTVRGTFSTGDGTYGHLNGYRFQLHVSEIRRARRIWSFRDRQRELSPSLKATLCEP